VNADSKKTVLRMIPYGIYILTADDAKGNIAAAAVNWVTQTSPRRRSWRSPSRLIPVPTRL
jgi:flavin reductase (DIM6/NTAB) family NADH-FMN oxidoreductase RutF